MNFIYNAVQPVQGLGPLKVDGYSKKEFMWIREDKPRLEQVTIVEICETAWESVQGPFFVL